MFEDSNAIYGKLNEIEQSIATKHEIQLFRFNGLDIPFSKHWKKVGINLSGGADSACLTYLLCKIITENNLLLMFVVGQLDLGNSLLACVCMKN